MGGADGIRDMSSGLAYQFEIAQCGIIGDFTRYGTCLVESFSIGEHLSCEIDHIIDVETPFAPIRIRH
jgi:hypothetical protein